MGTDCYSCHFYEFNSCLEFILNALRKSLFPVSPNAVGELIGDFRAIFAKNQIHGYTGSLSCILAELFSKVQQVDYYQQIVLTHSNSTIVSDLLGIEVLETLVKLPIDLVWIAGHYLDFGLHVDYLGYTGTADR